MARIDALFLEDPCCGSRRIVDYLAKEGIPISRRRVHNLIRRMGGLRAIYQKPRTTIAGDPSERFPCLVEINEIKAVDQIWASNKRHPPQYGPGQLAYYRKCRLKMFLSYYDSQLGLG